MLKKKLFQLRPKKRYCRIINYFTILFLIATSIIALMSLSSENYKNKDLKNNQKQVFNESFALEKKEDFEENISENSKNVSNENKMQIHFLDVGQGDSIFLELPNQETMLIDAGESNQSSKIIHYIENLGYRKIDYVIATHPHTDHIGGLKEIIETFEIKSIYMPKVISTSNTYENLLMTIQNQNLKIKNAYSGVKIITQENFEVEIIAPTKTTYQKLNNYSAVIKITYKDHTFLFMGDAEEESEKQLKQDIKADVIKIGHHGSATSTSEEFIKKVNPSYAIISVGKNNRYNHPNELILNRLKEIGAKILQTDQNGTIMLTTNGKNISLNVEKE